MAKLIRQRVTSCEQCVRESRVDHEPTRPALQIASEHVTAPEDAMEIDLLPEIPLSGGYENLVTVIDVFSRFLFAYATSSGDAKTIAKVIVNIMTKHAYLPTTIFSGKGSVFMSQVIKAVTEVLGITQ